MKQIALAQRIGVSRGFVSKMISGKEGITHKVIDKLRETFPLLNINWLLYEEGEMFSVVMEQKHNEVSEPEVRYEAKPLDPLASLRELLEWHDARLKRLEEEVRLLRGGEESKE